jgi:hypothetical protein
MSDTRYTQTLASEVPTPPSGKRTLFYDSILDVFAAKDSAGNVSPLEVDASGLINVTEVNSAADFPDAVAGVRTIGVGEIYIYSTFIDMGSDEFVLSTGSALIGVARQSSGLISTTTGTFITATESFQIRESFLSAASGTLLDLNGDATQETCLFTDCFAVCDNIGTINEWNNTIFRSFSFISVTGTGLLFTGASGAFNMDNSLFQGFVSGQTMIDYGTATFTRIQIPTGNRFAVDAGVTAMSGLVDGANLLTGGDGVVSHNIFEGAGTFLNGLSEKDIGWNYQGNAGIPDSRQIGSMFFGGAGAIPVTTTLITSTPVIIAGTFTESSNIERFSVIANPDDGAKFALQFDDVEAFDGFANVAMDFDRNGGGAPTMEVGVYQEGSLVAPPRFVSLVNATSSLAIRVPISSTGGSGDYFDVRCNRISGTANMDVRNITFDVD